MNWENHLKYLNSKTLDEINDEIDLINLEASENAMESMNEIHFILVSLNANKYKINKIKSIEKKHRIKSIKGARLWLLKNSKEKYQEDLIAYKKEWYHLKKLFDKRI